MKDGKSYGNKEGLAIGIAISLIYSMALNPYSLAHFVEHPDTILISIGFWLGTLLIPGTLALLFSIISYFVNFGKVFGIISLLFFGLAFIGHYYEIAI